jgi:hypothetical protein
MSNDAPIINFELTIEQANAVLAILGNAPFVQSAGLINLLQEQAGPQVRALQIEEAKAVAALGEEPVSVQ